MNLSGRRFYILGAIAIVLLLIVGYFMVTGGKSTNTNTPNADELINAEQLSPDVIGLSLSASADKKRVIMKITKLEGVKSITYELSYDAQVVDKESGEKLTVTHGLGPSTIEVKPNDREIVRSDLTLGTCSSGVCRYDDVVSDVKFVIKVIYNNGRVGVVEESLSL